MRILENVQFSAREGCIEEGEEMREDDYLGDEDDQDKEMFEGEEQPEDIIV